MSFEKPVPQIGSVLHQQRNTVIYEILTAMEQLATKVQLAIPSLPTTCPCDEKFNGQHGLSWFKVALSP